MKTGHYTKIGFLLHLAFYFLTVNAQEPKPCGNYKIDTAAFNKALQTEQAMKTGRLQAGQILLRIFFHIVTNDDGSNAAATTAQLNNEFNTLVSEYAADNICFLNTGFDYINN